VEAPDGAWRVEVVKRGRDRWYRIVNGDNRLDWLSIGSVQRILGEAGTDRSRRPRRGRRAAAEWMPCRRDMLYASRSLIHVAGVVPLAV
jgi:hypothetical protein